MWEWKIPTPRLRRRQQRRQLLAYTYGTAAHAAICDLPVWQQRECATALSPGDDLLRIRQQARNVFTERCRLRGLDPTPERLLQQWWPGTRPMAAGHMAIVRDVHADGSFDTLEER